MNAKKKQSNIENIRLFGINLKALIIISILCMAAGVYWNSVENEFVNWDDDKLIVQNRYIRDLDVQNVKAIFTPGTFASYQPVRTLSYAIDYSFWKLDPKGYHFSNIFLNTCNTLLVYLIAFSLSENFLLACVASILFAVHPVHVEAVTWLSGRRDVLSLAFALFSFYCFGRFRKDEMDTSARRRSGRGCFYWMSFLSFTLGLLTKASLVIFPGLILLYDWCFTPRVSRSRKWQNLFVHIPFFLVTIGFLKIFLSVAHASGVAKASYYGGETYTTFLTMVRVFGEYIVMLLAPKDLSVAYGVLPVTSVYEEAFLFSVTILALLVLVSLLAWGKFRVVFFGIGWFFISLLPVSNIIPISVMKADRYLYLPSVGSCLALAALIAGSWNALRRIKMSQNGKKLFAAGYWMLIASFLCSQAAMTIQRNRDWKNSHTLWAATLDVSPRHPIALNNLGLMYAQQGQYDKAIALFEMVLEGDDIYFEGLHGVLVNMGHAYLGKQMFAQATEHYQRALQRNPNSFGAYLGLGNVNLSLNQYDLAIEFYQQALNINPSSVAAYNGLGLCYIHKGERKKGEAVYQQALRIAPESAILENGLGKFLFESN